MDVIGDELHERHENGPVIFRDLGDPGLVIHFILLEGQDGIDHFPDSLIFRGHHGNHGDAESVLQGLDVDADALRFSDIDHIHGHDDRRSEQEKFRKKVKAPLQGRGVDQMDDDVRVHADDKIPGDPLFLREGGEAVCSGEVHNLQIHILAGVNPFLFFHGLAGPVAHVLGQSRQDIEDRGFPHIGLPGESDKKFSAFPGLFRLRMRFEPVYEYPGGFPFPQGDPGIRHLDNDGAAPASPNPDLRVGHNAHAGKPACQGLAARDGIDDPCFVFPKGNKWYRFFAHFLHQKNLSVIQIISSGSGAS